MSRLRWRKKRRENGTKHELPYTEIKKPQTFRLALVRTDLLYVYMAKTSGFECSENNLITYL